MLEKLKPQILTIKVCPEVKKLNRESILLFDVLQ
jgi:hypothetical protein